VYNSPDSQRKLIAALKAVRSVSDDRGISPDFLKEHFKMADAKTVLEFAKKNGVKLLDLRFTDLPGLWQHVSYPIGQLT